ncbi:MAG: radical SAM protein [Bacteriovoracales bacterium]|nr:radical SAM protein [Bacteriovoracales bacterium]
MLFPRLIHSLYLHFPYCRHLCNYCDFFKSRVDEKGHSLDPFHHWLEKSWDRHEALLREHHFSMGELKSLYFGGGTPSLWGREGALFFDRFLKEKRIILAPSMEWTMELNPGSWEEGPLSSWIDLGVNRFSVGVQSLRDRFLKVLDRIHNKKEALKTLAFLQKRKINYSVDFMIGLPFSEKFNRQITEELDEIFEYAPSHLSLYILTVPEQYIHFRDLPSDEFIRDEYLKVYDYLQSKGMVHYEVSNYAFPGKESFHNLEYWSMASVAALGPSATGLIVKDHETALRYKWKTRRVDFALEPLDAAQIKLERLYMQMRTNRPIRAGHFFHGKDLRSWEKLAQKWKKQGHLLSTSPFCIGPRGHIMLDAMMDDVFSAISGI